jgi:hypothetical protein
MISQECQNESGHGARDREYRYVTIPELIGIRVNTADYGFAPHLLNKIGLSITEDGQEERKREGSFAPMPAITQAVGADIRARRCIQVDDLGKVRPKFATLKPSKAQQS